MLGDRFTVPGSTSSIADISLSCIAVSPKNKNSRSLWRELSNKSLSFLHTAKKPKQRVLFDSATVTPLNKGASELSVFNTLVQELDLSSCHVSFWWNATARPLALLFQQAQYPATFQRSLLLFFHQQIIPQLGPGGINRESYMTDDGCPMESSCVTDGSGATIVRFSIEPLVASDMADRRFQSNRKALLAQLVALPIMSPDSDLEWFNIFSEALTLQDGEEPPANPRPTGSSEFFIGFDCKLQGLVVKAYFIPDLRSISSGQPKERMIGDVLHRVGLDKPWSMMTDFFSTLATQPDIYIVAVDCVPNQVNRVKIYVRLQPVTYANLESFMTLGGTLNSSTALTAGLHALRRAWQLLFELDPISQANESPQSHNPDHYASAISVYYELKPGHSMPFPKAYLPVRHYAANDAQIALKVASLHRELGNSSIAENYMNNIQQAFSHRPLSSRSGIHTYVSFAVKATKVEISSYFNPEAYAPERGLSSSDSPVLQRVALQSRGHHMTKS